MRQRIQKCDTRVPRPGGILGQLGWLIQEVREHALRGGANRACAASLETAIAELEDELVELETTVLGEQTESPFFQLWNAACDILESVMDAIDQGSEQLLDGASGTLSLAYQLLADARTVHGAATLNLRG